MHKRTDEGWDPYRLANSGYKVAVLNAQKGQMRAKDQ